MNPFSLARAMVASPKFRAGIVALAFTSGLLWGLALAFVASLLIITGA
jgi:hypothetical protein